MLHLQKFRTTTQYIRCKKKPSLFKGDGQNVHVRWGFQIILSNIDFKW
jgi:hypothetical protein